MNIQALGMDIAKNVFQLHGVNRSGYVVLKRRVMRDQLLAVLAQIDPWTVVIEACTGAFYWASKFEALGHRVKIISPQYVKPLCVGIRTTAMTPKRSARPRVNPISLLFHRRASSSRTSKAYIAPGKGWSITVPRSSARSAGFCSIGDSLSPRALPERGVRCPRSLPMEIMS